MMSKQYKEYMNSIDVKIINKAKSVKLLILDVDGVLTDGGIYISENGSETKKFYAQDGHGLILVKNLGVEIVIISGRYSKAVEYRGNELGFKKIIQNSKDKLKEFNNTFGKEFNLKEVCFVGDDIVDVSLMQEVGLAVTVPNANYNNLSNHAHWITPRKGGYGAVRDVCDLIVLAKK